MVVSRLPTLDDRDMETSYKRLWRSYMRFSLRGLIALVLIVGGWLGWMVRNAQVQRDAVASIRRSGGRVWFAWQVKNGDIDRNAQPRAPKWLVDQVGVDYFGHVVIVGLGSQATDSELSQVGRLSRVETLILHVTEVSDAGLAHIRGLTRLKKLDMGATRIGDAGLRRIAGLTGLQSLNLNSTRVTDAGLKHLEGMTNLRGLGLHRTSVTDAGLVHLAGLRSLQEVELGGTRVTDAGVRELQNALPLLRVSH